MRRDERPIVAAGVFRLFLLWESLVRVDWLDASLAPALLTAWEVLAAFLIAVPVGLGIGFALAEVPALDALFRPLVNFLFGVPRSIFLPVFILIFGVSIPQKIAFGVFTTIFVLIVGGVAAQSVQWQSN